MDNEFWHQRWQRNEIGFHRDSVNPALKNHWSAVCRRSSGPVLVPLCGKSLDMHWLARQGHAVVGVELDRGAVEAFFEEAGLVPEIEEAGSLPSYTANDVRIFVGDFLEFDHPDRFELVYDRAALIALPAEMRPGYLAKLASLMTSDASGLLITLEYDQDRMQGPPFSVMPDELADNAALAFKCLERSDELPSHPRFADKGLNWLNEAAYAFTRR